jgi:hypothetical protein
MKSDETNSAIALQAQASNEDWLLALMPADTPIFMFPAWIGAIRFALGTAEAMEGFRRDTGNQRAPGKTPLDRMIDEACGADIAFLESFIKWANVAVWGPLDGPEPEDDAACSKCESRP